MKKASKNPEGRKEKKPGRVGRLVNSVGQTGAAIGNVAGQTGAVFGNVAEQTLHSIGNVADKASRKAGLLFADKIKNGEIAPFSASELAQAFAEWLGQESKGQVEFEPLAPETGQFVVKFKAAGLVGKNYRFVFVPSADETLTSQLSATEKQAALVMLAGEWPIARFSLEKELSLFIWQDGVRLGKDGSAAEYLADWLVNRTGYQFEKKDLIDDNSKAPVKSRETAFFIGRDEIADSIGRAILGGGSAERMQPWIFSIWGEGGLGKSYLLQRTQQLFGPRLLYAQVDHQNPEDSEEDFMRLISSIANKLRENGCPTPHFDRSNKQLLAAQQRAAGIADNTSTISAADVSKNVGKLLGSTTTKKLANKLIKNPKMAKFFNPAMLANVLLGEAGAVGVNIFEQIRKEQQAKNDAVLNSRPIQELTEALIEDLQDFVEEQRKKYYLWRRPVLVFDTYELIGPLADQWLRTVFLKNPIVQALEPAILIAGRYELLRFNSRWSEYQSGMEVIKLDNFSRAQAKIYLEKLGVKDPARIEQIYELTGGLPLFLSLVAKLSSEEAAIRVLNERILEEIEPEWQNTFIEMAVPDGFNLDTVQQVIDDKEKATAVFERLSEATFVEGRGGLLHYLPVVRHVLLRYGELKSPEQMAAVRKRLA